MSQKAFTMVFYIVPEDQDDIEQPNAFGIHKNQEDIKANDISDAFPLPGEYIFRYRYKFQNNIVWMDINSNSNKIPLYNGKIYVKATRISWNKSQNQSQQGQNRTNNINASATAGQTVRQSSSQNQQQQQQQQAPVQVQQKIVQQQQQQQKPVINQSQQPDKQTTQFNSQGTNQTKNQSTNLLDDFDAQPAATVTSTQKKQAQTNLFESDLLDMDDISSGSNPKSNKSTNNNDDLWNF